MWGGSYQWMIRETMKKHAVTIAALRTRRAHKGTSVLPCTAGHCTGPTSSVTLARGFSNHG
jgi:hypothetical protein